MTDYQYECTNGHGAFTGHPINACPAFRQGEPCDGKLKAFGAGSDAENRRLAERQLVGASR